MSAGAKGAYPGEAPLTIYDDLFQLAPAMRVAVEVVIAECQAEGLDAVVHETYRSHETAVAYYARGRTQIPPAGKVTNAPDETWSWHGYGLAVDIISASKGWSAGDAWFAKMGRIAEKHGLKWGGRWKSPDLPHVQWGKCRQSPSDEARRILREDGMEAVWKAVGAS